MKRALIAIGGNALCDPEKELSIKEQFAKSRSTARTLVELVAADWKLVLTHGNGPQVGVKMRARSMLGIEPGSVPLGLCGAETEGEMGYMLQQTMGNALRDAGLNTKIISVVTQVLVDQEDPAFSEPTKPIGMYLEEEDAQALTQKHGWAMKKYGNDLWRRHVASPVPKHIVELLSIGELVDAGVIPIVAGGGGVPVVEKNGHYEGVAAVIDKDLTSALAASELGLECLVIVTGVSAVQKNFGTPQAQSLHQISVAELQVLAQEGEFGVGTMAPKIKAAIEFLEKGGQEVLITDIQNLGAAMRREEQKGTWIRA
ncbi:MAG: carbamate kinase [Myxococcota bacterium]|jgi:carbamate kinase|nr:carbamate kinase [Myxococcota bacterium]